MPPPSGNRVVRTMSSSAPGPVVGLVGGGWAGRHHWAAWRRLGVPVVWCARTPFDDNAPAVGDPSTRLTHSLDDLLENTSVIDVCTPTDTHADIVRAAIAAKRDVICEKPLARTSKEAAAVAQLAAQAGVQLLPAHVVRWVPAYQALAHAVRAGRLGDLVTARFTRITAAPWSEWFADEERSGGIILDQMIHDIDQALLLLGPAVRVQARHQVGDHGTATATVVLTHTGGQFSHATGVWGPSATPLRTAFRVVGTTAVVEHDSMAAGHLTPLGSTSTEQGEDVPDDHDSPFVPELRDLLAAITSGHPPRVTTAEGIAAVAVAEAALESARSGHSVEVAQPALTKAVAR